AVVPRPTRRYLYFAKVADIEGFPDVAGLFKDTADGETGHAHGHLDFLKQVGDPATGLPIGNTEKNLKSAVAGETHEYETMYPGMAKQARDEGFDDIAEWFETLAKAEKSHAGRFQKALGAPGFGFPRERRPPSGGRPAPAAGRRGERPGGGGAAVPGRSHERHCASPRLTPRPGPAGSAVLRQPRSRGRAQ